MFERISLTVGRVYMLRYGGLKLSDLKREEGQGATEYAMVLAFLVIGLGATIGLLGDKIETFLSGVGDLLGDLLPSDE